MSHNDDFHFQPTNTNASQRMEGWNAFNPRTRAYTAGESDLDFIDTDVDQIQDQVQGGDQKQAEVGNPQFGVGAPSMLKDYPVEKLRQPSEGGVEGSQYPAQGLREYDRRMNPAWPYFNEHSRKPGDHPRMEREREMERERGSEGDVDLDAM